MDMTKQEVTVIKAAIKSRNKSKLIQPVLFAILIGALLMMLFGTLSGDEFTYLAIPLVFITILSPQLSRSPKYSELVEILEKQLPQNATMDDVFSQELKKKNNNLKRTFNHSLDLSSQFSELISAL